MSRDENIGNSSIFIVDKSNEGDYYTDAQTGLEGEERSAVKSDRLLTTQEVCELLKISKKLSLLADTPEENPAH